MLGSHAQVVLLRWGLGLQIQVLQTLASLQQAEPKPWIPPSQKFGSGAKGDSWPSLPTQEKLNLNLSRNRRSLDPAQGLNVWLVLLLAIKLDFLK